MAKYTITTGAVSSPLKVVLYGPEGIGKSTFANMFPTPVFIDTEGGTKRMNVARLPAPTSWQMLLDEVAEVAKGNVPCATLVVDTADWAERLCITAVCAKFKVNGIEDFGYGKGYTYAKEEFAKLLDTLEEVTHAGIHVVVTAHAQITRFEQPDAVGSYDRWSMKTSKQVAPLLREWCDMLLFANYKTVVEKSGTGTNAKNKATGGKRVMYTTHNPCWDAKNRFGLPDELPFDYEAISHCVGMGPAPAVQDAAKPQSIRKEAAPRVKETPIMVEDAPAQPAAKEEQLRKKLSEELDKLGYPAPLRDLMVANNVNDDMLRHATFQRGCYPEEMPVAKYDPDLIQNLLAKWPQWLEYIQQNCDIPF